MLKATIITAAFFLTSDIGSVSVLLVSVILGGAALFVTVMNNMNSNDRRELNDLRLENPRLKQRIIDLIVENDYLLRRQVGLPASHNTENMARASEDQRNRDKETNGSNGSNGSGG